jgi:hypothetical protein
MQAQARSVLPPAIAALAVCFSISMVSPPNSAANAAETCLAEPKGAPPQGSHWRYRLEQGSQRKCWRLVQMNQKSRSTAARTAPQADADEEEVEAVATPPAATRPGANKSVSRVAEPAPQAAQGLVTQGLVTQDLVAQALVTKNASNTADTTPPVLWPDPPADMMQRVDAPAAPPLEQTQNDAPAPAIAQPPVQQPVAASDNATTVPPAGDTFTLRFLLAAIALLGFVVCAMFYVGGVRRRRADVLNKAQHLNRLPTVPADDAPTFQPLPPMSLMLRHDDVEEAMQRFAERLKRRAA